MTMLLGKSELVEHKEAENRGLTRRLEQMQQLLSDAETSWNKVLFFLHPKPMTLFIYTNFQARFIV